MSSLGSLKVSSLSSAKYLLNLYNPKIDPSAIERDRTLSSAQGTLSAIVEQPFFAAKRTTLKAPVRMAFSHRASFFLPRIDKKE